MPAYYFERLFNLHLVVVECIVVAIVYMEFRETSGLKNLFFAVEFYSACSRLQDSNMQRSQNGCEKRSKNLARAKFNY